MSRMSLHEELSCLIRDHEAENDASKDQSSKTSSPLHPVVSDFKSSMEADPHLYSLFHQMFEQIPTAAPYFSDPLGKPQIRSFTTLLAALNLIIQRAPSFLPDLNLFDEPILYILEWPMCTTAGRAIFSHSTVNHHIRNILCQWATFLQSPESLYALDPNRPDGCLSPAALAAMPNFAEEYICDASFPYYGFQSWDDFFTRRFRPGVRPVALKHDSSVIVSACEATPYRIATDVQAHDRFWIKKAQYSVAHMLGNDDLAPQFYGGSIYQAYLDALSYHRWNSPVAGVVVKAYVIPGSYYATSPAVGHEADVYPNGDGLIRSQTYLAQMATRAVVFIEADDSKIGLVAFLAIGMDEVSSCDVRVIGSQRVEKGEELGTFRFGGSSWCLLLRREVRVKWKVDEERMRAKDGEGQIVKVNEKIAIVVKDD